MATYRTPGVYVEEISTLPPSVAEVATAIPAFIGYTEKTDIPPTRISSMIEYKERYGGPPDAGFEVTVTDDAFTSLERKAAQQPLLYYSLRLYFDNGGGPCYIVSVGDYAATPSLDNFKVGLDALKEEDEPTLIVMPDATRLLSAADFYLAGSAALDHCGAMKDRFAILDLDVKNDVGAGAFRTALSSDYLDYGAAYTPYLNTALTYAYDEAAVTVTGLSAEAGDTTFEGAFGGITVSYTGASTDTPSVVIEAGTSGGVVAFATGAGPKLTITLNSGSARAVSSLTEAWSGTMAGFDLAKTGDATVADALETSLTATTPPLDTLKTGNTALHAQINTALGAVRVTLPPSPAMAGIYARVDRERGVWKAPANVAVSSVISLTQTITDQDQDNLNIDATGGKSINAIRSFTGRGTLVWGARTLAGNDNEWRYVPVRRLFIMIEESTQKATAFAVFEPNDAGTWLKVKAMIESYLYGLWQQGALAGPTPEAAYFVNVGLGKTMTSQDVLEGRMIVEIGIAAVRPAEFIILRFSHKMQEA